MPDWSERDIAGPHAQFTKGKKRNSGRKVSVSFTALRNSARKQKELRHDGGGPSGPFKRQFLAERKPKCGSRFHKRVSFNNPAGGG